MNKKLSKKTIDEMKNYPQFYQRVWFACAKIPKGTTCSYSALALQIGLPGGARAVANALARNPFAPRIPCHRVIRKDGSIGGYSAKGGIKRKKALLKSEFKMEVK